MHIILTGLHMDITDSIRTYTLDKMSHLEKYVTNDSSAKLAIELSRTTAHHIHGDIFQAEAQLHIRGLTTSHRTTQNDLYKAVDVLKDMLVRELASHKDKERSVVRRSAHKLKSLLKRLTD